MSYRCKGNYCNRRFSTPLLGGVTAKPLHRLFKYLRAHEAQRGSEINNTTRLRGHVELDAHKVRTAWISKKTKKYRNQVAALQ